MTGNACPRPISAPPPPLRSLILLWAAFALEAPPIFDGGPPTIVRNAHLHRSRARSAVGVGRGELDGVDASIAAGRALGADPHASVAVDDRVRAVVVSGAVTPLVQELVSEAREAQAPEIVTQRDLFARD